MVKSSSDLKLDQYDLVIGGGEKQAAISVALAYPEYKIAFLTDQLVVDGWDLPNVDIFHSTISAPNECERYLAVDERWCWNGVRSLYEDFSHLSEKLEDSVLPVSLNLEATNQQWQVKGNHFHKPDGMVVVDRLNQIVPDDIYGCGLVYQPRESEVDKHFQITGRSSEFGNSLGVFRIYRESVARQDYVYAAESVDMPGLVGLAQRVIDVLGYRGYYNLNILQTRSGKHLLSSFRPVPKPFFSCLRKGGVDLLNPTKGNVVADSGIKMIADVTYNSYQLLCH